LTASTCWLQAALFSRQLKVRTGMASLLEHLLHRCTCSKDIFRKLITLLGIKNLLHMQTIFGACECRPKPIYLDLFGNRSCRPETEAVIPTEMRPNRMKNCVCLSVQNCKNPGRQSSGMSWKSKKYCKSGKSSEAFRSRLVIVVHHRIEGDLPDGLLD
jgi:hypothetical protein